jgi:hypothetical protein
MSTHLRRALGVGYAVLILLPTLVILFIPQLPHPVVAGTFLAYAFALLPTFYLDHWFLGGIGYHSPSIFALLTGVVAVLLWPLPLLSAKPTVWRLATCRRAILGYGAVFFLLVILAAWQMTRRWALFFG